MSKQISAESQLNKMTKTPVHKLIIMLGIPTTISMLITNVYNMADSFFVSQISLQAGGATSIVFGVMSILQAFGFMFGHGAGSFISRSLGNRQTEEASKYASLSFFMAFMVGVLIMTFGLIFLNPFMQLLGSTDTILPYARDYALFILIAAPFMTSSCVLNNVLRYEGRATLAMIGLTTGGLLNMALDPLFIFVFKMGILGAGLATAISQVISFFILFSMYWAGKTQSKISFKFLKFDMKMLGGIILTGLPSLARQGLNSISTMIMNAQAKVFGDAAIAAMGYVARTTGLIFSVGLGIGQGFQPVSGYNYGAGKYSRVKKGALFTLFFGMSFIGLLSTICFIFAPQIISIFGNEPQVISIGGTALRIYCIALLTFPASVVTNMLFQSIGKGIPSLLLSCLQSGLLFIPLCLTLPSFLGMLGIELSQPIAYTVSAMVALPCLFIFLKKLPPDKADDQTDNQQPLQEDVSAEEMQITQNKNL